MVWAGRSLSKVMTSASCLSWRLPVTTKASVRVIGAVVGLVAAIVIVATVVNHFHRDYGLAAAGVSMLVAVAVYGIAWMAMSMLLPRATRDPGALLPGAVLVGAVLAGMQAVAQLYLPDRLERRRRCTARSPPPSSRSARSSSSDGRWCSGCRSTR